jgi:hypothetical protein
MLHSLFRRFRPRRAILDGEATERPISRELAADRNDEHWLRFLDRARSRRAELRAQGRIK